MYKQKPTQSVLLIFQSPDNGGTRTYFFYLIEYLLKKKVEIHLLVKTTEFSGPIPAYCEKNNIKTYLFENEIREMPLYSFSNIKTNLLIGYNYLKQIKYIAKLYFKIRPRLTIISQGWPFIWFKALFIPGKKIFIQHVMPLHFPDKGNKMLLKIALFFNRGMFISVSDYAQNKMREFWLGNYSKVQTIYNYVEKTNCIEKKAHSNINILALARVEDGKNPLLWIDLAEELNTRYNNLKFTWAGSGSLLEKTLELTKENPKINFIGFIDNIDELYAETDIYFEPSKREAHGISVVGAMAWKIPAVATNNGGTVESVVDGETGFIVDVTNKEQMLDRLEKLIINENLRLQMGQKARIRYEKMFTKEIWEAKMDSLFH